MTLNPSGAEHDARQLSERLHRQNQERMKGIEDSVNDLRDTLSPKIEMLIRIDENTKCIPSLKERVESLESSRDKVHGVMWALGLLWVGLEAVIHFFFRSGK
jgi:hypothetical protein